MTNLACMQQDLNGLISFKPMHNRGELVISNIFKQLQNQEEGIECEQRVGGRCSHREMVYKWRLLVLEISLK